MPTIPRMSYSVDPPHLLGIAERVSRSLDELHEIALSLRRSMDATARALTRAMPAHAAFAEVAGPRVDLAERIVARGRAAVSALQSAVVAYLTADEEMVETVADAGAVIGNPFDPILFGRRRV